VPKRLGYKTDACMMLIRREINDWMIKNKMNKSRLVNDLLRKYFEWELCRWCLGGVIHSGKCKKCSEPWVRCEDPECMRTTKSCDCTYFEMDGID